ncbi:lipid A biosynthesis acyltransferase [Polynucleobacter paneuropaeus]|nr:lipid A biosynthesis acyltransferase [Polynucleobacter paneuropaeus]QWD00217.1 lipid A biosynthesis acyltransferase [Polynucleobacter paneuropaeus]
MIWLQNLFNFLALNLLRLFAFLPYRLTIQIGYGLGWLAAHIPNERAKVVKTNLRLCFPSLSESEIDAMALEHWKLFGRSVLERSRIWLGSDRQITDIVSIESEITLGDRKPRLLINPHFVGLEGGFMALSALASKHDWPRGAGLYQNMKNPFFNQKMIEWRNRFGGKSIERQSRLRDLIREIQTGNFIFIAPDIDLGPKDSVFVPFFGIPTNTITSVSRLAKLSGAEVCLMTTTLNPDRNGYTCHIGAALPNFPSDDVKKDTARLNRYIEELVRERPAEYYWVHKRFKHRPPGEPNLYS